MSHAAYRYVESYSLNVRKSQIALFYTKFLLFPSGECKLSQHDAGVPDVCESEERPASLPPGPA